VRKWTTPKVVSTQVTWDIHDKSKPSGKLSLFSARIMAPFIAAQHRHSLTSTRVHCSLTEQVAYVCVSGHTYVSNLLRVINVKLLVVYSATAGLQVLRLNHYTTVTHFTQQCPLNPFNPGRVWQPTHKIAQILLIMKLEHMFAAIYRYVLVVEGFQL